MQTEYLKKAFITLLLLLMCGSMSLAQVNVSLPDTSGGKGESITVPVTVSDMTGENIIAYEFRVEYDVSLVRITGASTAGTLSEPMMIAVNPNQPGRLIVAAATATPLSGEGALLDLQIEFLEPGYTDLAFTTFLFNTGRPEAILSDGSVTIQETTGATDDPHGLPLDFSLKQNYPNPFNPGTVIQFTLPESADVLLEVYDILGRRVATLIDYENFGAGRHSATWNGKDFTGNEVSGGIYIYRIEAGIMSETRKMIFLK